MARTAPPRRSRRLRYSKAALLLFGLGLVLGLIVVSAELVGLGWVASALMALGLVAIPLALLADGKRAVRLPRWLGGLRRKSLSRKATAPASRPSPRVRPRPAVRRRR